MENHDPERLRLREPWQRREESQATVAMIFAGIAALFIAGIAAAFIYAKDTPLQTASAPAPAVSSSKALAPPTTNAPATRTPETTGSGGLNYTPPKQHPRENEQKERP
jgi:hypothetical protein